MPADLDQLNSMTDRFDSIPLSPAPPAPAVRAGVESAGGRAPQRTLCLAYAVFGLPKEAFTWQKSPDPVKGQLEAGAAEFGVAYRPDVLGSSPRGPAGMSIVDVTKLLHGAMRCSFPTV